MTGQVKYTCAEVWDYLRANPGRRPDELVRKFSPNARNAESMLADMACAGWLTYEDAEGNLYAFEDAPLVSCPPVHHYSTPQRVSMLRGARL